MLLQRKFVFFFSFCVGVVVGSLFLFLFVCMSLFLVVCIIDYQLCFSQVLKLLGLRKFGRPGPERPGDVKGGIARRKM